MKKAFYLKDLTDRFEQKDINDNKNISFFSYMFILVLIPYLKNKNSKYVMFNVKQGLNLLLIEIGYIILSSLLSLIKVNKYVMGTIPYQVVPSIVRVPLTIIGIIIAIYSILGLVNVYNGKAIELPLINKIKVFK